MVETDVVIIGAGPAGLAAAIYGGRTSSKVTVLEKAFAGGQVSTASDIGNYPGFPEGIDGMDLAQLMREQAERYEAAFAAAEARSLERLPDGRFAVQTDDERYEAKAVILATGAKYRLLGIPGEDKLYGRGVSFCGTCDAPFFKGKSVAVVGGGNSAVKEALHISHYASHVTMFVRKPALGNVEGIYKAYLAKNDKVTIVYDTIVTEVLGSDRVEALKIRNTRTGKDEQPPFDGLFVFIGSDPSTALVAGLLELREGGFVETDYRMMSSIPGLFVVGDARLHSFRQVATAVGEGATAAIAAQEYIERIDCERSVGGCDS